MNLLCAVVTHNRLEYSKLAISSLIETLGEKDHLVVFDNSSDDGTQEWLKELDDDITVILCDRNLFPGAATNRAWYEGMKLGEFGLLMRSDNDIKYAAGWRDEVDSCFEAHPKLAQLGLLNRHEDYGDDPPITRLEKNGVGVNVEWDQVGGNCVIRRKIWDEGFRWEAGTWQPGGMDEDSIASAIIRQNHLVATVIPTIAHNMSFHRYEDYPAYYDRTASIRGLVPELSV